MSNKEPSIPESLKHFERVIRGKSYESAKRAMVAQVGSVNPREKFNDDVADAVFLRLQHVAQVGRYASEKELAYRQAKRLEGEGDVTLYRCAPPNSRLRPGDFAASTPREAGFYKHGINTIQAFTVKREDVIAVEGAMGGGHEFVLLPKGHVAVEPLVHFKSFRDFFEEVRASQDQKVQAAKAIAWLSQTRQKKTMPYA